MIIIFYNKYLKEEEEDISNFIKLRQSFYGNEVYGVEDFEKFKFFNNFIWKTTTKLLFSFIRFGIQRIFRFRIL